MDVLNDKDSLIQQMTAGLEPSRAGWEPRPPRLRGEEVSPTEALAKMINSNRTIAENIRLRMARQSERHIAEMDEMHSSHETEFALCQASQEEGIKLIDEQISEINKEIERLRDEKTQLTFRKGEIEKENKKALNDLSDKCHARINEYQARHEAAMSDLKKTLSMAEAALSVGATDI
jgi:TolA-binding protein